MKEKSWVCTLITQLSLCIAAYIALSIGQPQKFNHENISTEGSTQPIDMHFITVVGGFRPVEHQTLLLRQMVNVAKIYKARFVVFVSDLGKSDPLLQNAMMFPELQNMPWYSTGSLGQHEVKYLLRKIEIPYGQTLDIIAVNIELFQDPSSVHGNDQILWLTKTLNESDSDRKIVFGLHQLITCDYNIKKMEEEKPFEPLHNILLQYEVDAYMPMKMCTGHTDPKNQTSVLNEERVGGFLLHQVTSLETVVFDMTLTGEIEHKRAIQLRGRAAM